MFLRQPDFNFINADRFQEYLQRVISYEIFILIFDRCNYPGMYFSTTKKNLFVLKYLFIQKEGLLEDISFP